MTVPIVFCTDKNLILQTCVTISSLLLNAKDDDFYDIYILLDKNIDERSRKKLQELEKHFVCCSITLINFEYNIKQAHENEYITKAAYYRLFIPEIILKYDKIFYSDVDIIFRNSISTLYKDLNINNYYIAAGKCLVDKNYIMSIGCDPYSYFCDGFILLNSKKIREDNLIEKFTELISNKYKYLDQDVFNIVLKNREVLFFSPLLYQFDQTFYYTIMKGEKTDVISYSDQELQEALSIGLIHYTGVEKPWKYPCFRNDVWWEYYRKHPYFDKKYYFEKNFGFKNGDYFSLKRRIRLLIRYFFGKKA